VLTNYHEPFRKVRVSSSSFHTSRPYTIVMFTASRTLTFITIPHLPAASEHAFRTSAFPLSLRGTHVVFFFLKQFSAELATEAEVFLDLLSKLVSGEAEAGETRTWWMRVLAMEIMRGCVLRLSSSLIVRAYRHVPHAFRLCGDPEFMRSIRQRYDALATDGDAGSASGMHVFTPFVTTL